MVTEEERQPFSVTCVDFRLDFEQIFHAGGTDEFLSAQIGHSRHHRSRATGSVDDQSCLYGIHVTVGTAEPDQVSAVADGIRNQPHQAGDPQNLVIVHNTILKAGGDAIRSDGIVGSVLIANNAIYAQSGNAIRVAGELGAVSVTGNVGTGSLMGITAGFDPGGAIASDFVAATFSGAPPNDVFPAGGSLLVGAASAPKLASDDFNGTLRDGQLDAGAYKFDASGNPGWVIVPGFKADVAEPQGGGGAGAGGESSGGGGPQSGGNGVGAGGADGEDVTGADDGCGCSTKQNPRETWALGLLVLLLIGRSRSRRKN